MVLGRLVRVHYWLPVLGHLDLTTFNERSSESDELFWNLAFFWEAQRN